MWCHLTYRVAKSGGKENPQMKPRPNNGCRGASSDVREYKIGIRGGIKWRHLTYRVAKKWVLPSGGNKLAFLEGNATESLNVLLCVARRQ